MFSLMPARQRNSTDRRNTRNEPDRARSEVECDYRDINASLCSPAVKTFSLPARTSEHKRNRTVNCTSVRPVRLAAVPPRLVPKLRRFSRKLNPLSANTIFRSTTFSSKQRETMIVNESVRLEPLCLQRPFPFSCSYLLRPKIVVGTATRGQNKKKKKHEIVVTYLVEEDEKRLCCVYAVSL